MANDNTILNVTGTASLGTTAAQSFLNAAGASVSISIPASWNFDCRPFQVRMVGKATNLNATSVTIQPTIYLGTATATTASNVALIVPSAVSSNLAVTGLNFLLDAEFLFDSTSGSLNGNYQIQIGPAATTTGFVTTTKSTSVTTGLTLGGAGTLGLNFVPYVALSATSTNNVVTLVEFSITQE